MFKKHISPKAVGVAILVLLLSIQFFYWRALVYRDPRPGVGMGGGGGGQGGPPAAVGREDVSVETAAGEAPGFQDGPAWQARFSGPNALAIGPDASLFVTDSRNHRVRKVSPAGHVSTVAGGGDPGGPGGRADGPAEAARFRFPSGVAAAPDGTVYVSDTGNHRICRVRDGQVTTLAGGAEGKADGQGGAARFRFPAALTLGPDGALWVADLGNRVPRRVSPAGEVTTPAVAPAEVAAALGDLRSGAGEHAFLESPEARLTPVTSRFTFRQRSPGGVAGGLQAFADPELHVVMTQRGGELPLLVAGRVDVGTAVAGTRDGQGHRASFARPCATAVTPDGTVYVADYEGNRIRRLRLPEWLSGGEAAPEVRRFGRRRQRGR